MSAEVKERVRMLSQRHSVRRRIAMVAGGVIALSTSTATLLATPAFAAPAPAMVPGTPCTVTARACVDLKDRYSWLIQNGKVVGGRVDSSSGGDGEETPIGTYHVLSKDKDHKSQESRLPNGQPAPMPWSVFFAPGGIAFHSGDPEKASAGCIHLPPAEAERWFNTLKVGDEVQVREGGHTDDGDNGDDGDDGDDDNGDDGDDGDH
ncbi:L,D-transpeptidase [Pseudonocardia spinosispora]|uniref:L,D-transpeptidase n=1 Tax=Pseudonocardia spinosispora TaxID=103441 RepID=UPI0004039FCB|nr:L,D-transpeptidase [Pseudonocardia spinosispora]